MKGILGRKLGMTQVFTEDGVLIPVTVVEAAPNIVLQKKTVENDGYEAVQLGFEDVKERRATKAPVEFRISFHSYFQLVTLAVVSEAEITV